MSEVITMLGYEQQLLVGEGGMGRVVRAYSRELERLVALKFATGEGAPRLAQEREALQRIRSAHVVELLKVERLQTGQDVLVLEYLHGRSLAEILGCGPLVQAQAVELALQACRAVKAVHDHGFVHRDLKPENFVEVVVAGNAMLKLVDFGSAVKVGARRRTAEGTCVGTVYYMSPEQLCGQQGDERSDIWALGVVLYQMLTETLPFQEPEIRQAILSGAPRSPLDHRPQLPPRLAAIVQRCLQKDPKQRFGSVDDLRLALEALRVHASGAVTDLSPTLDVTTRKRDAVDTSQRDSQHGELSGFSSNRGPAAPWPLPATVAVLCIILGLGAGWHMRGQAPDDVPRVSTLRPALPAPHPKVEAASLRRPYPFSSIPALRALEFCGSETLGGGAMRGLVPAYLAQAYPGCTAREELLDDQGFVFRLDGAACPLGEIRIRVPGSRRAFEAECADAQIRMTSADYDPEELRKMGCSDARSCVKLLGLDGTVLVVPRRSPLVAVSQQELAHDFGFAAGLRTCGRGPDSGTTAEFTKFLESAKEPSWRASWRVFATHEDVVDATAKGECDLAFTSFRVALHAQVRMLAVSAPRTDGVSIYPDVTSILLDRYPLVRRLRVVHARADALSEPFWSYLNEQAANTIMHTFALPTALRVEGPNGGGGTKASFLFATGVANQFANESDAREDLDRLVDDLEQRGVEQALPRLSLVGYQDRSNPTALPQLALERCQFVARVLEHRLHERYPQLHLPPLRADQCSEGTQSLEQSTPNSPQSRRVEVLEP